MQASILDFDNYKSYLSKILEGRGLKQQLSEAIGFQSAFLSRVFSNLAELSLEQAIKVSHHLGHTAMERDYFILLVIRDKAGSEDLKQYYNGKIAEAKKGHDRIGDDALKVKRELSEKEQAVFYSSWLYQAICILVTIKGFNTTAVIAKRLRVSIQDVDAKVEFLIEAGLLVKNEDELACTRLRTHVKKGSPYAVMCNQNWRMKAAAAMAADPMKNIHYTGTYSLSHEAAERVKIAVLNLIQEIGEAAKDPNETRAVSLTLDLFEI